jgi:hypothetical protein
MAVKKRRYLTKKEAVAIFNSEVKPSVIRRYGRKDKTALRTAWNDFTDMLHKNGMISDYAVQNWVHPKF